MVGRSLPRYASKTKASRKETKTDTHRNDTGRAEQSEYVRAQAPTVLSE